MRLRAADTELEAAGESTDGMAKSTAALQAELKALAGVDIMEDSTTFKSTYDILKDLSDVWGDLTDIQQASVTELVAGKHRGAVMSALMKNFDLAEEMKNVSENSFGSALREEEVALGGIEAKLNQFKAATESLSNSIMGGDFLKGFIDMGTGAVSMLDSLISSLGQVPTLIGAIGTAVGLIKGDSIFDSIFGSNWMTTFKDNVTSEGFTTAVSDMFTGAFSGMSGRNFRESISNGVTSIASGVKTGFGVALTELFMPKEGKKQIRDLFSMLNEGNVSFSQAISNGALKNFSSTGKGVVAQLANEYTDAESAIQAYGSAMATATVKTVAFKAIAGVGMGLMFAGVSAAISLGITALDKWIHRAEEARKLAHQVGEESIQSFSDIETNKSSYDSTYEAYRKGTATKDELTQSAYSLAASLGVESTALDNLIAKYGSVNKAMDEVINKNYEQQKAENLSNIRKDIEAYTEDIYQDFAATASSNTLTLGKMGKIGDSMMSRLQSAGFSATEFSGSKIGTGLLEVGGFDAWTDSTSADQLLQRYDKLASAREALESGIGIDYSRSELEDTQAYSNLLDDLDLIEGSEAFPKLKEEIELANKAAAESNFDDMFKSLNIDKATASFGDVLNKMLKQAINGDYGDEFYGGRNQLESLFINQLANYDGWDQAEERYSEYIRSLNATSAEKLYEEFDFNPFKHADFSHKDAEQMSDTLNKYTGDIQTLKNALADLEFGNLKGDELDDLFDKFPELEQKVQESGGNVHKAIRELMDDFGDLAEQDLEAQLEITTDPDAQSAIQQMIDKIHELADYTSDMEIKLDISAETEDFKSLYTAIDEAYSETGLTSESLATLKSRYKDLAGYDPSKLFEHTANGMSLNNKELAKLEDEYESFTKSLTDNQLDAMLSKYERLTDEMKKASQSGDFDQFRSLSKERDNLADDISAVAELASQYEGLTSAYNKWINAKNTNDVNSTYEGMQSSAEEINELYKKGYTGRNDFKAGLQMWTNKNVSGMSEEEIHQVYDEAYATQQRYFTDSQKGAENFVNDLVTYQQKLGKEWVKFDDAGNFEIDFGTSDKEVADLLSTLDGVEISTEQIQALGGQFRALNWDWHMTTDYSDFDNLKTSAESAYETLQNMGKLSDFELNLNVSGQSGLESIESQIEQVKSAFSNEDGTFNVNAEGAEEAQAILAALIARKQQLEEPAILTVSTSNVEESLQSAVTQMQAFQSACNDLEISVAVGDDGGAADAIARIRDAVSELQDLDPDIQAKIGIDDSSFQSALNNISNASDADIKVGIDLDDSNLSKVQETINSNDLIAKVKVDVDKSSLDDVASDEINSTLVLDNAQALAAVEEVRSMAQEPIEIPVSMVPDGSIGAGGGSSNIMAMLGVDESIEIPVKARLTGGVDITTIQGETPTMNVNAKVSDVDTSAISASTPTITVNVALGDTSGPDSYEAPPKEGLVTFNKNSSIPDSYQPANKNATVFYSRSGPDTSGISDIVRTVTYNVRVNGSIPKATGTITGAAFPTGTFADSLPSNWKLRKNGVALMGELGPELIVNGNSMRMAGEDGAEFTPYHSGDIIFNASQTKELMRTGKIKGRGKLFGSGANYASGSIGEAFSNGSGSFGKPIVTSTTTTATTQTTQAASTTTTTTTQTTSTATTSADTATTEEEDLESVDWIEKMVDRIERAFKRLERVADSDYYDLPKRFAAAVEQIDALTQRFDVLQQAYDRYLQEADSIALSDELKALVRDGSIDVQKYDKDTKALIDDYSEWYEKALDISDQMDELKETLSEIYQMRFDLSKDQYDNNKALYEYLNDTYQNGLDYLDERGFFASDVYYNAMKDNLLLQKSSMEHSLSDMISYMSDAVNSGQIKEWSAEWYEMQQSINDVKLELQEVDTTIEEINNSMRELSWDKFDYLLDLIDDLNTEAEFFVELMSYGTLIDKETGSLTDTGLATMGMYGQQYNTYMAMADKYGAELKKILDDLKDDPYDQELIKRESELRKSQQQSILSAQKMRKAIGDLIQEGFEAEMDALDDLIDKYSDALDAQKDLYDYQRKLNDQTKEISSIQKQLAAYAGDDSEETQAKVQKLKDQLEEAEQDLQDTEFERSISEQKKMLDNLKLDLQTTIDERMDNIDALIDQQIADINANSSLIDDTLHAEADKVGYTMSDNMQAIWDTSVNPVLSTYNNGFTNQLASILSVIQSIANFVQYSANKSDTIATKTTSTATKTTAAIAAPTTPAAEKKVEKPVKETPKEITVGSKINAAGAPIYASSTGAVGQWGTHQAFSADPIYVVTSVVGDYVLVRHHTQSANAGWFKKSDVNAFKRGGIVDYTGPAWVDGTKSNPEAVLNAADTKMLFALTDALRKSNLNDNVTTPTTTSVETANSYSTGDFVFNIDIDHVEDYNELVTKMRDDLEFENMIQDMTVNKLTGKGSNLAKYKRFR